MPPWFVSKENANIILWLRGWLDITSLHTRHIFSNVPFDERGTVKKGLLQLPCCCICHQSIWLKEMDFLLHTGTWGKKVLWPAQATSEGLEFLWKKTKNDEFIGVSAIIAEDFGISAILGWMEKGRARYFSVYVYELVLKFQCPV